MTFLPRPAGAGGASVPTGSSLPVPDLPGTLLLGCAAGGELTLKLRALHGEKHDTTISSVW